MATSASLTSSLISRVFSPLSSPNGGNIVFKSQLRVGLSKPTFLSMRTPPLAMAFARRNKKIHSSTSINEKKSSKVKKTQPEDNEEEADIDEDAFEALFNLLEEDLKNDLSDVDGADEVTKEDLVKLEKELEEALGDVDFDELQEGLSLNSGSTDDNEDPDEEETRPKLKNWQLKRLAYALKIGRRKTSIKSLAAELCLDRDYVLQLLRDPPPHLLLMSVSLPDKVPQTTLEPEPKPVEPTPEPMEIVQVHESDVKEPVHIKQTRWSMQKRLKKVHVETLERVYSRTKRPTNAMISSIVHLTNLPFKRVVKWFEDKRVEDGVPDHHLPFRRSKPETVSTR